jgi:hypothetical protein
MLDTFQLAGKSRRGLCATVGRLGTIESRHNTSSTLRRIEMSRPITREYRFPPERVFVAAVQAVQSLGYKIDKIDKANGLLTFKTGMSWKSTQG